MIETLGVSSRKSLSELQHDCLRSLPLPLLFFPGRESWDSAALLLGGLNAPALSDRTNSRRQASSTCIYFFSFLVFYSNNGQNGSDWVLTFPSGEESDKFQFLAPFPLSAKRVGIMGVVYRTFIASAKPVAFPPSPRSARARAGACFLFLLTRETEILLFFPSLRNQMEGYERVS